jgi:acyl-coenzyme A synthetase/AMP-(fatty) acid ligase
MRGCSVLLVLKGEKRSQSAIAAAKNAGIALVILQKDLADPGLFYTSGWQQQPRANAPRATDGDPVYSPTERADTVLILHTSGTTGYVQELSAPFDKKWG